MEQPELNEILEQHKLWIETNGAEGKRANLKDAYLRAANLLGARLNRANLRYAYLNGAKLTGANLNGADLTGADLGGANLTDADLRGANLTDADLRGADLTGADLRGADLTGADLTGANLTDANLTGANLTGANLTDAILPDVSWIIPGCLVQLNQIKYGFYLKNSKWEDFVQDSFGFIVQNNVAERTFDMLAGDRIIRNIPDWVKYSGLKQIESESV